MTGFNGAGSAKNKFQAETLRALFAEIIQAVHYEELPPEVVIQSKKCLLDLIGVTLAGGDLGISPIATRLIGSMGGKAEASVIGKNLKLPAHAAAFLNSVQGHALDMDDGHRFAHGHPGVVTIPAALAMTETTGLSGRQLLEAIVVGYEIFGRLGTAINPNHLSKGFHTTATIGTFAAAAAAAKILCLSQSQIEHSLALAGLQSAGLLEALVSGQMSKSFQVGKAAQAGVLAACLAKDGAQGPNLIFEGQKGFFRAFSDKSHEMDPFFDNPGDQFEILKAYFKGHAACRHAHASLDAVNEIRKRQKLDVAKIDSIEVDTYTVAIQIAGQHTGRDSAIAAKFSIPVSIGLMLVLGNAAPDAYTDQNINNDMVQAFADKVIIQASSKRDKAYPGQRSARVSIKAGQQEFSHEVLVAKGEPENPLSDNELLDKFIGNATKILSNARSLELSDLILHIEKENVSNIFQLATP
ncbi:MAG: MmgE/PrpD family protein [Desulfobacterales bacterium]